MDKRLMGLGMLSNFKNNDWKIGKTDFYINSISSKVAALPEHVFNHFYISDTSDKQISIVDFALMTYDMGNTDKLRLMEMYDIDSSTIDTILSVADDISEFLEEMAKAQSEDIEQINGQNIDTQKVFKTFDDEVEI